MANWCKKKLNFIIFQIISAALAETNSAGQNAQINSAAINDGKYYPIRNNNNGKYHHTNTGKIMFYQQMVVTCSF